MPNGTATGIVIGKSMPADFKIHIWQLFFRPEKQLNSLNGKASACYVEFWSWLMAMFLRSFEKIQNMDYKVYMH